MPNKAFFVIWAHSQCHVMRKSITLPSTFIYKMTKKKKHEQFTRRMHSLLPDNVSSKYISIDSFCVSTTKCIFPFETWEIFKYMWRLNNHRICSTHVRIYHINTVKINKWTRKLHTCLSGLVSSMCKSKSFNPRADTFSEMDGTSKFLAQDVQNISSICALCILNSLHTHGEPCHFLPLKARL